MDIVNKAEVLTDVDYYIGDGSSIKVKSREKERRYPFRAYSHDHAD